jgi:hypothetical protein
MRKRSLQCDCCHEAGHAVVAERNGYRISRIRLARSTAQSCYDTENGSMVEYEPQEWTCPDCHQFIEDRNNPLLLANLNNRCRSCKREKLGFVERCFAGGVATDILEEPDHNWDDSQFDREQVGKVFPQVSEEREEAFRAGCEQARTTVLREKGAVRALRDALMKKGTDMDGEEAMQVIRQARI